MPRAPYLLVLLLVILGCAGQQRPAPTGSEPGAPAQSAAPEAKPAGQQILVQGWATTDKPLLDPARAATSDAMQLSEQVHSALVRYPAGTVDTLKIEPDVAERWETSTDGTVWTFFLRKGVQFHKGFGELTSEDVRYSFERVADPEVKAVNTIANIASIETPDPYTIRFTLVQPDAWFLTRLLHPTGALVSKKAVEQLGLEEFNRTSIGSGPFLYDEYVPRQSLTLLRHEAYHRGKPIIEKIIIKFMGGDENIRGIALRNKDIHIANTMDNEELNKVLLTQGFGAGGRWGSRLTLYFKLTDPPLDNLKVRQAFAYAVDREAFRGIRGYEPLCEQVLPTEAYFMRCEEVPADLRYDYNPEKARQLLAEAGLPNGFSLNLFAEEGGAGPFMLMIKDQVKKVGIELNLQVVDRLQFVGRMREGVNPVVIWRGSEATPDQAIRDYFHSASIVGKPTARNNWSNYGEKVGSIDALLDRASATLDQETQRRQYTEMQLQLLRDLPGFPIAFTGKAGQSTIYNPRCIDLGFQMENASSSAIILTEKSRVLASC